MDLYERKDGEIVRAPAEDEELAATYASWPDKGEVVEGRRVTIMTAKQTYSPEEDVRVLHVMEATEPGMRIHVMGPKEVYDEHVDDELRGPAPAGDEHPFEPDDYDGRAPESPGVDFNYDITTYAFPAPGVHRIQWRPGQWRSNVLTIDVR